MDNALKIIRLQPDSLTVANNILTSANGWHPSKRLAPSEATPIVLPTGQVLGAVDWSSLKADDAGLWVQRVLVRRNKYVQLLQELIERGLITTAPVCQAAKSAGVDISICKDVLVMPTQATKSFDWGTLVLTRALGLRREPDYSPALARLRLKRKAIELKMAALGGITNNY